MTLDGWLLVFSVLCAGLSMVFAARATRHANDATRYAAHARALVRKELTR